MQQRSVFTQTTYTTQKKLPLYPHWMRHFFTDDVSPDSRPIMDLQRRATWIGSALILQTLSEIEHAPLISSYLPFGSIISSTLMAISFFALWMAFRPTNLPQQARMLQSQPRLWQRIVVIISLLATIGGVVELGYSVYASVTPPQFSNDGTSLDTNAAMLLLQGRNPYTDSNILELARKVPIQPVWTTPLRLGQLEGRLQYPSTTELQSILDTDFKSGHAVEFESKVSYPVLSFLTLVPFALFNQYNVLSFYLISYLVILWLGWKIARPELRPWVLLLGMANIPMWSSTMGGNLDIFCTLLIIVAWWKRDHRWLSALFLGLALATKQTSWFLVPFYAIMAFRLYGLKEVTYRLTFAGTLFVLLNLPFILWNPHAWLAGIMAPIADPMFPLGVGFINLSVLHYLPIFPTWVYSALEGTTMLLCLVWYWRLCRTSPEAALQLAVIPLFFAWRSLPSYFYCAAYPIMLLMAAKRRSVQKNTQLTFSNVEKEIDETLSVNSFVS